MPDASSTGRPMAVADLLARIARAAGGVLSTFDGRLLAQIGAEFARDPITASRFFLPRWDTPTAWREIANKVEVFVLVRESARILGIAGTNRVALESVVRTAYGLGAYAALWGLEGLGHEYAAAVRRRGEPLVNLLRGNHAATLPPGSLLMLHAGVGLEFAQVELDNFAEQRRTRDLPRTLETILGLCRDNSQAGYVGAAYESLGLVARTLHPELVRPIDAALVEADPAVVGFFWHGVGRAIYFLPANFIPCGHVASRTIRMEREEATHELAGRSAMAGFAWAFTVVNMRHPDIVADLIKREAANLSANDAFANGVASTVVMRQDTTAGAELIARFLAYRPDRRIADMWTRLVRDPASRGVAAQPELRRTGRLDQVFRYQPGDAGGVQGASAGMS
jgi:hypothetical protein